MENDLADALDDVICASATGSDPVAAAAGSDVLMVIFSWIFFAGGVFAATQFIVKNIAISPSAATGSVDNHATVGPQPGLNSSIAAAAAGGLPKASVKTGSTGFLTELVKENGLTSRVIGTAPPPCSPEREPQQSLPELTNLVETKVTFREDVVAFSTSKPAAFTQGVGSDPDAVAWVNAALTTVVSQPLVHQSIVNSWLESLTDHTKSREGSNGEVS